MLGGVAAWLQAWQQQRLRLRGCVCYLRATWTCDRAGAPGFSMSNGVGLKGRGVDACVRLQTFRLATSTDWCTCEPTWEVFLGRGTMMQMQM